ncbi:MAG TPA: hypothetical protein VGY54_08810, partial [Polyangiaceae bacterium]|nr:hypothetical protein [Polyangiaceae bacterium]
MKRTLLATSFAFAAVGILGSIGLNCSDTTTPYVPPGGSGSSSGGGSGSASGSSVSGSTSGASTGSVMSGNVSSGVFGGSGSGSVASGALGGSGSGSVASGSSGGSGSSGAGSGSASGSSGASSGSGGGATLADIFGIPNKWQEKFMDSFILFPCYSNQAQDCITVPGACPNMNNMALPYEKRGVQFDEYFQLGGTAGQMYQMTFHVDGITEAKYYMNGMCDPATAADQPKCKNGRAGGEGVQANADTNVLAMATDSFYTAGAPVDQEFYNVYKMTIYQPPAAGAQVDPNTGVAPPGAEVQHYYLNSFPSPAMTGGVAYEQHSTYMVTYTHTIAVPGGGIIQYHMGDTNCHAIDNCGSGVFTQTCAATAGRTIPGLTIPATTLGRQTSVIN